MPNKDNSELIQFISEKFDGMEKKMDKRFDGLEEKVDENGNKIDKAMGLYKKQEEESASMGEAVRRNEKNIATLAKATDTEIE